MFRKWIIADYQEAVRLSKAPQELKDSLKSNERLPAFIDNLVKEFAACEKVGVKLDRQIIKQTVYNLTEWFMAAVHAAAEKRALSDAEKARLQALEVDPLDDQGNADLTEEFGVKIVDKSEDHNGKAN